MEKISEKSLVIVESPAKAKTIMKLLGKNYQVKATIGHIKDLPKNKIGIDVENDFKPSYQVLPGKDAVIKELQEASKTVTTVFLAPDPDREGEAIAWHIADELKPLNKKIYRVLFNEITEKGIHDGISNPQPLDENKLCSQQARRIMDRLVGYKISPLLWKKVRRGLSAGRVQSVTVRLICEREQEIKAFKSEEYWSIAAMLQAPDSNPFEAKLAKISDQKAELKNETDTKAAVAEIEKQPFIVAGIEKKSQKRNAPPPFITSTLQQEAARKLNYSAKKTMLVAQQLYEGIELGKEGTTGLVTYIRTDSTRLSEEAVSAARQYIEAEYGKAYLPESPVVYKTKKSIQDAHEAIRPTSLQFPPSKVKKHLKKDQFELYQIIWNRFVACQMNPAIFDQTTIELSAGKYLFRANGRIMKFNGFTCLYLEGTDEAGSNGGDEAEQDRELPPLNKKDRVDLREVKPNQHFTQPPPRYTESSLVKTLEENGIGRPSTYATILSNIEAKGYVAKENKQFHPTELGEIINQLLIENFESIINVEFTANMETELDHIEEGTIDWLSVLNRFYTSFKTKLRDAEKNMRNLKAEEIQTDLKCDKCGKPMVIKWGRNGRFLACSGYPECKNTKELQMGSNGEAQVAAVAHTDEICPKCSKPMVVKHGRFGKFLACSGYPECKTTKSITTGIHCPLEGCDGEIVERKTKRGKTFYGCTKYPKCTFASWNRPLPEPCPDCGSKYLIVKITKKDGVQHVCPNKECTFKKQQDMEKAQ